MGCEVRLKDLAMDQGSRRKLKIGQVCPVFRTLLASDAGVSPVGLCTSNSKITLQVDSGFTDFHQLL